MSAGTQSKAVVGLLAVAAMLVAVIAVWIYGGSSGPGIESSATDAQSALSNVNDRPVGAAPEAPSSRLDVAEHESDSVRQFRAQDEWIRAIVDELLARGDAASLVGAALLMRGYSTLFIANDGKLAFEQKVFDLLARAAALSPQDPAVQWLAKGACENAIAQGVKCNVDDYDASLRAADPSNARNWLGALTSAASLQDKDGIMLALDRMGNAKRFEDYRTVVSSMAAQSIESARVAPPNDLPFGNERPVTRLTDTATRVIPHPSSAALYKVCNPMTARDIREPCRRIAKLMMTSDNLDLSQTGIQLAKSMESADSPVMEQLRAMHRKSLWQTEQAVKVAQSQGQASQFMKALNDRAQLERFLRANNISIDPPKDWEPSSIGL